MFEAINFDYLRTIVIGFYREKGNVDTLFESYRFSISSTYKSVDFTNSMGRGSFKLKVAFWEKLVQTLLQDEKTIKSEVENLLSQFSGIDSELRALPKDSYITIRLVYHPDTPPGKF